MAFTIHTLTNLGATMIANATVGNKLIIAGCALSHTQYTKAAAEQLNALPYDAPSTLRISAASIDNRVEARATFLRSQGNQTGGNWYSMILWGRMANEGFAIQKPIAVIVSDEEFYIPEVDSSISDVSVIFSLGFQININTIQVPVETIYALESELSALRSVAVTTTNINDPSLGDAQTIKGQKTFNDFIVSDRGMETNETMIDSTEYIVHCGQFLPDFDDHTFRYNAANIVNTTDGFENGLYLDLESSGEITFNCITDHAYIPGLVSDRTDYYYVGCITMIAVLSPVAPSPDTYAVGSEIQYQNGILEIYAASWDPTNNKFDIAKEVIHNVPVNVDLKNMKFRLMTQCKLAQFGTTICLAMRVE